jgi:serine/threonine protein kinase
VCYLQAGLVQEATLMKRFDHPCVLPLLACFVSGRQLWMVTAFMGQGSIRSIMLRQFPQVAAFRQNCYDLLTLRLLDIAVAAAQSCRSLYVHTHVFA